MKNTRKQTAKGSTTTIPVSRDAIEAVVAEAKRRKAAPEFSSTKARISRIVAEDKEILDRLAQ